MIKHEITCPALFSQYKPHFREWPASPALRIQNQTVTTSIVYQQNNPTTASHDEIHCHSVVVFLHPLNTLPDPRGYHLSTLHCLAGPDRPRSSRQKLSRGATSSRSGEQTRYKLLTTIAKRSLITIAWKLHSHEHSQTRFCAILFHNQSEFSSTIKDSGLVTNTANTKHWLKILTIGGSTGFWSSYQCLADRRFSQQLSSQDDIIRERERERARDCFGWRLR